MENRKRRRNANKNGSKWKVQAGKNNTFFTRYNRKNKLVEAGKKNQSDLFHIPHIIKLSST